MDTIKITCPTEKQARDLFDAACEFFEDSAPTEEWDNMTVSFEVFQVQVSEAGRYLDDLVEHCGVDPTTYDTEII